MPEITKECQDMTNASSTYLSIVVGAIIGGIVSAWIYIRQKKISNKQDITLKHIEAINERHDEILKRVEEFDRRHDSTLNAILELNKKIEEIIEKQNAMQRSMEVPSKFEDDKF